MKGSENMTDEEKDILKKHIRYRAVDEAGTGIEKGSDIGYGKDEFRLPSDI